MMKSAENNQGVLLSIIIPVYNAQDYLPRCLDSLLAQGLDETAYEIVCVNDGSTDGSLAILETYGSEHSCVKVVSQENAGCPVARNRGMEEACGQVITFCDADDYVIPNAYSYLLDNFWHDDVDVIKFDSITMDRYVQKEWKETNDVAGDVMYKGCGKDFYAQSMQYFVWSNLYRRSFLEEHSVRFRDLSLGEDTAFCLDLFMYDPRTVYVNSNIYRYTISEGQITGRREKGAMRRIVDGYLVLLSMLEMYSVEYPELSGRLHCYQRQQLVPCMSRVLSADYNAKEYSVIVNRLKELSLPTYSYVIYKPTSFLYRKLFVPYVLPRLRRNKKLG